MFECQIFRRKRFKISKKWGFFVNFCKDRFYLPDDKIQSRYCRIRNKPLPLLYCFFDGIPIYI